MTMKATTKQIKPMSKSLEEWAQADGQQRGIFFDTSGKLRCEWVSATSTGYWLFKTKAGKPFLHCNHTS